MPLIPYLPILDSKSYNSNGKIVKGVKHSVRPETNRTLKAFSQCGNMFWWKVHSDYTGCTLDTCTESSQNLWVCNRGNDCRRRGLTRQA